MFVILSLRHIFICFYINPKKRKFNPANVTPCSNQTWNTSIIIRYKRTTNRDRTIFVIKISVIITPSHIKRTKRIDFIFVSFNLLQTVNACGSITFHKITCSDHKGFFLDEERYYILQDKRSTIDSLFSRSLISSNPQVIRKYISNQKEGLNKTILKKGQKS